MSKFDYNKAEADLYDVGCHFADEVYDYRTDKGFNSFMRENGLNPDKYRIDSRPPQSNRSGYSSHPGYPGSGMEGCYLTTACVKARNLPDDCTELQTLRSFRDNYLAAKEQGPAEIEDYYRTAPQIVASINARDDAGSIWNTLYHEMILPCVDLISRGENEQAYLCYKTHCQELKSLYL